MEIDINEPATNGGINFGCETLRNILEHHPFIGASIIDYDGKILWVNERDKRLYFPDTGPDYRGKHLHEFFPREMIEERLELLHQVCDSGKPAQFTQIRLGKAIVTTYHKLHDVPDQLPQVLVMACDACSAPSTNCAKGYIQFDTEFVCLGPLDKLSNRELEVLVLLSQALTTVEIADTLNRSPKTIEAHRSTISRKLGAKNRIQLAEIAHRAMLEIRHTKLKRIAV